MRYSPLRQIEWTAWPSLSSRTRSPSGSSITRAYWYSVSRSQITLPSAVTDFVAPTGMTISSAIPAATAAPRPHRRPSAGSTTRARARAKIRKVRWVPTSGISSSDARKVPVSEPMVPIA